MPIPMSKLVIECIQQLAENDQLLEVGRKAIEDELIEMRDSRLSSYTQNNGFVIKEKDGQNSDVIRFGPEIGLKIALKAMANKLMERHAE